MTIIARTLKGHEYLYSIGSAHAVTKSKAEQIKNMLNAYQYGITPEQAWHIYDVNEFDKAYDYAMFQRFTLHKDGRLTEKRI